MHSSPPELLESFQYTCENPGKKIRSKLISSFDFWLQAPTAARDVICRVVERLHNASLMIDDIEDGSETRRGRPSAHMIYGIPSTINTANYVYFLALEECMSLNSLPAVKVFTEELLCLHRGQGLDIYWRDNNVCPSEEQYRSMVLDKTGGLFRLAVKLMQLFSENKRSLERLVDNLGLFFQIMDDYLNLECDSYMGNKIFCEDITEGKYSFPIIHGINHESDGRLARILRQRTRDVSLKKYAVELMRQVGSFVHTQNTLTELREQILRDIQELGGNPQLTRLVEEISAFLQPATATTATVTGTTSISAPTTTATTTTTSTSTTQHNTKGPIF
eukprot:gnl/Spiro4/5568_TR2829_c0_g1_i1.p1 gnl/Spiro4/5568_TR2829_c0_g1~~gnl/Spiro4/5568_TR2829_c0_g1_i1.p1  ORF type:complete len:349 (+),score=66.72 gnl/Spiro4/5568_TR2829_c0_g1_i1:49-1047(+)